MINLKNKVALVTGGGSGIGRRIAEVYGQARASVSIADINLSDATEVTESINAKGGRTIACAVDVREEKSVSEMISQTLKHFNSIDILVNSAGTGVTKSFLKTNLEDWENILAVNLKGTFLVGQAAAREMVKNNWGRIINIASIAGLIGIPGRSAYAASKGGVIALTKVMSVELGALGITVNAIAPGPVDTNLTSRMHTKETRKAYLSGTPLARYGTLDEQAAAALFLASKDSSYITGQTLPVDGGISSSGPLFTI